MPTPELMTWVPSRRRWTRMHKGKRHWISCKALGVPETKEASLQAANAWWRAKQAEIDAASQPKLRPLLPLEDLVGASRGDVRAFDDPWAVVNVLFAQATQQLEEQHRQQAAAEGTLYDAETDSVIERESSGDPDDDRRAAILAVFMQLAEQCILGNQPLPEPLTQLLPPARVQQVQDAVAGLRGEATAPADKTVEFHADTWLKAQQARVDAGQMTAARCANNRTCLEQFKAFIGPQANVEGINAAKLEGFYQQCLVKIAAGRKQAEGGWSVSYARDVFSVARAFIRWLVERGTIDPPRNLASKSFKFGSPAKAVQTWTVDEFKAAIDAAPGKLKLALLLMANTGATQEDVSDLKDTEVDWRAGRIIRKRSKTAACENVPVVNYRLWPQTFELLTKYRSGTERVLLTEQGEHYVRTRLREDGKLSKADGFASNYVHLKRKLGRVLPGFNRPLKQLRKLGATLLGNHPDYGRFQSYFLGHSPRTVADRSYVVPSQEMFDKAVTWLGQQLGQVEDKPAGAARPARRKRQVK
jgi:integrase